MRQQRGREVKKDDMGRMRAEVRQELGCDGEYRSDYGETHTVEFGRVFWIS